MPYHLESVDLMIRQMPPDRMSFAIGGVAPKRRPRAIVVIRVQVADDRGKSSWGVAADRPSFGWLDKRKSHSPDEMLTRLFELVRASRKVYMREAKFESPFALWANCWPQIMQVAKQMDHESLSASFASALLERAVIDAVCRLSDLTLFESIQRKKLGFSPQQIHPMLGDFPWRRFLPERPRTRFHIRHTVGLTDPIDSTDLKRDRRVNDGEPETLQEYVRRDGLRYFKVKISGDPVKDLARLGKIWGQLVRINEPIVTLDGNESYRDIDKFAKFVETFEREQLGMYQHTLFIEQPLTRAVTLDPSTQKTIRQISERKPLVIDEADGTTNSFARAFKIGYNGVSHKNCKGFFKSLANFCLCAFLNEQGKAAFQTGEDLSNMPLVAIQQDFTALGLLKIDHCERNGHHYGFGLSHLSAAEKEQALQIHGDLYIKRGNEAFLNIRGGQIECRSLQTAGFGVAFEPAWDQLAPLDDWEFTW